MEDADDLRASEARLRGLFDFSPISIWEEDFSEVKAYLDGLKAGGIQDWPTHFASHPEAVLECAGRVRILDLNQTSAEFFGAERKEDIPTHLPSYFTAESVDVFREEIVALARGETSFESEIPIRTPQGPIKTLYLRLQVLPGFEDDWGRVLVSFIDITSRKETERELARLNAELEARVHARTRDLERNELRHRTIVGLLSDWVFGFDVAADGAMVLESLSAGFEQATGFSRDDRATLDAWRRAIHPEDSDKLFGFFGDVIAGTSYEHECRLVTRAGEIRRLRISAKAHRDAGAGRVTQVWGAIRDVTERRKAEQSQRLASVAFDNLAEGILVTDARNNIVSVNRAFTQITGYEKEEVLGRNPRVLHAQQHDLGFYAAMWRAIQAHGVWHGELWNRRKSGEIFPAWQTISIVRGEDGEALNYVSILADISSIKHSQERLDFMAYHDPLTELPNRLLLGDRIEHAMQRAQREEMQIALLFLDMDRFKNINDTLGHPVGDELLKQMAQRLRDLVRQDDTVARLGGDEFVILMESIDDPQDCAVLARKVIESIRVPFIVGEHTLHLTVSIGISIFPDDGADSATLIRNADAAMYRAKEIGRNDYHFYTAALTSRAFERLTMETALRRALEQGELVVYYQPKVDLKSGVIRGAEALIRWRHPEMGMVPPDRFIPVAEESGLIEPIGEWVLLSACRQMAAWLKAGYPLDHLAVNVSGRQFQRQGIVAALERVLADTGLDGRHVELEITESVIMEVGDDAANALAALRERGATIAIDDFGTGYSSLAYLKHLPVTKLKIDHSFVRDIPADANDVAITRAIVAMGQSLQLEVVAEGIETIEQMEFLRQLGCDEGQGYAFSRPVPAEDMERLLQAGAIEPRQ